ncbi:hypothetical protein IWW45_001164 [Coemansia sp. RSA 485]|nr:hypothetical protein IWW45_001164 [Coemansia sp. RSA 485]
MHKLRATSWCCATRLEQPKTALNAQHTAWARSATQRGLPRQREWRRSAWCACSLSGPESLHYPRSTRMRAFIISQLVHRRIIASSKIDTDRLPCMGMRGRGRRGGGVRNKRWPANNGAKPNKRDRENRAVAAALCIRAKQDNWTLTIPERIPNSAAMGK